MSVNQAQNAIDFEAAAVAAAAGRNALVLYSANGIWSMFIACSCQFHSTTTFAAYNNISERTNIVLFVKMRLQS